MLLRTRGRLLRCCPWTLRPRIPRFLGYDDSPMMNRSPLFHPLPPTKRVSCFNPVRPWCRPLTSFQRPLVSLEKIRKNRRSPRRWFSKLLLEEICRDRSTVTTGFAKWDKPRRATDLHISIERTMKRLDEKVYIFIFRKGIFYLLAIESISTSYKICTILFHYGKVEF